MFPLVGCPIDEMRKVKEGSESMSILLREYEYIIRNTSNIANSVAPLNEDGQLHTLQFILGNEPFPLHIIENNNLL